MGRVWVELNQILHIPDFWWNPNEASAGQHQTSDRFQSSDRRGSVITWLSASSVISRKGSNSSLASAAATSTRSSSRFSLPTPCLVGQSGNVFHAIRDPQDVGQIVPSSHTPTDASWFGQWLDLALA